MSPLRRPEAHPRARAHRGAETPATVAHELRHVLGDIEMCATLIAKHCAGEDAMAPLAGRLLGGVARLHQVSASLPALGGRSVGPAPVEEATATGIEADRRRARVAARRARVVTVTSGKGGVGKTTLVANLGLELARLGRRVLLLDGALGLANLAILFNQAPKRTLEDALAGRCRMDDVVLQIREGLRIIPSATGVARHAALEPAARGALLGEIARLGAEADVLVIDTGAGIGPIVQEMIGAAGRAFLVTTHEPTALSDAYGLLKAVRKGSAGGAPRIDVVVNMAQSHAHALDTHSRLGRLTERFLGFTPDLAAVVPRDEAVGEAITRQEPLTRIYPYAPATRAIAAFARLLVNSRGPDHANAHSTPLAVPIGR
ncbi:MAG: AAA family ATPase [Candidatus Rokuibacteriota bacterium]